MENETGLTNDELRALAEAEEPRAGMTGLGGVLRAGGVETTEVLLVRHGQMPPATDTRVDQPLTEIGEKQADVLGRFLARSPLHAIYTSPALRARQTGEAIGRHTGLGISVIEDLREAELYLPDGVDWDVYRRSDEYKALTERFIKERRWEAYGDVRESGASMQRRISGVIDDLAPKHRGQRIVLVTHGPMINAAVSVVTESPFDSNVSTTLTGVTSILVSGTRRRLLAVNSRAHFGLV